MKIRASFWLSLLLFLSHDSRADALDAAVEESASLPVAALVPRSAWIRGPSISGVTLSPNGKQLAFARHNQHQTAVWLLNINDGATRRLFTTTDIKSLNWSGDGQLLFFQRTDGIGAIVTKGDTRPIMLMSSDGMQQLHYHGVDHQSPRHIFVSTQDEASKPYTLYRIDFEGQRQKLYESKQRLFNFLAPDAGPIKFIRKSVALTHEFYRVDEEVEQRILVCDFEDACGMAAYAKDGDRLYLTGRIGSDIASLLELTEHGLSVIHRDPRARFDIANVVFDRLSSRPLIAEYETDSYESYAVSNGANRHLEAIESQLESHFFSVEPDDASNVWLVVSDDPRRYLSRYFLYNTLTQRLTPALKVGVANELSLDESISAVRTSFWYTASDGMQLHGYVTLPRGVSAKNVPLIVMPHGGPWSRTRGFFSKPAQFLANRGYAVFEPNFRASVGFGRRYMMSANRDFGRGRVHKDIIEGTEYLLSRDIGNRDQLAIVGHSFGGFSALGALAFEPKMFKVGFAAAAPATLSKAIRHYFDMDDYDAAGFRRIDVMALLAVDIDDPEDLNRSLGQSPDAHASLIDAPVFLWAGAKDERVNILDVRDYALRLKALGKDVTLLSAPDAGHSPNDKLAADAYFYFMEHTLQQYLDGKFQSSVTPRLQRYLSKNIVLAN